MPPGDCLSSCSERNVLKSLGKVLYQHLPEEGSVGLTDRTGHSGFVVMRVGVLTGGISRKIFIY